LTSTAATSATRLSDPARRRGPVAIDTEHWHHVSLIRKILLRMRSWQNYFFEGHYNRLHQGEPIMRWVHMALICVFAAAVIIFAVQNLQLVTVSFLGFNARVPLALLAAGIYLLGTVTGGSLLALLRQSIEGAKRPTAGTP
jgi:uncharacterized integral membrane protein